MANEIFLELTRTLCPVCLKVVDGQVITRDKRVYMRRFCKEHGISEGMISSDVALYTKAAEFNKPGTEPLKFLAEAKQGCPYDCGICPEHKQHTCLAIIEVTNACNMRCPTCFASSGSGDFLDMATIEKMVGTFVSCEAKPDTIMISGGEPTIHPDILDIISMIRSMGIKHVVLNTNGKRIARDQKFAEELAILRPVIYLQFDGFNSEAALKIRGEPDLVQTKVRCLQMCEELDLTVILVMTAEENVNTDEIGAVAKLLFVFKSVKGVVYQPVIHSGRHEGGFNPMTRMTLADVVHELVEQSDGLFRVEDFIPDPCPFPTCGSTTYIYIDGNDIKILPRLVNIQDYLHYIENRTSPDPQAAVKAALEGLFSASAVPGSATTAGNFCDACGLSMVEISDVIDKIKMIKIKPFMDAYTFDLKRIMKCCVHEITADGRMIPFCAYNNIPMYRQTSLPIGKK